MSKKGTVVVIMVFSLFVVLANFYGCASKKKVEEPKQEERKAPEKKPAPKPLVKEPIREVVEEVAELKESELTTIYFDFDKSNIKSDMVSLINRNASLLNEHKNIRIKIEGHCDERGTNEYNQALGDRRANSVKRYLIDYGISNSRISTISYGEERPTVAGHNESAWSKNRRSEFIITSQ